ncbi:sulfatase family protein [Streptomyces sp. YPW6]|uniref:sulfatase family protein n=1 Tax=Streptomyces sp. YPW6 TaxID=2840373 RepID=UPI003EBB3B1C
MAGTAAHRGAHPRYGQVSEHGSGRPRRPNLLLVIADQFRAAALGAAGADPVHTPVLDTLATRSRNLTQAVSNYPVCSPCRAMLMTGRYPHTNGVDRNVNSATAAQGAGLRPETPCWSDVLSEAGYALGYIGKWHLEAPCAEDEAYGEGRREDGVVWDAYTAPDRRHGFGFWYSHGCCDDHFAPHYWTGSAPRERPTRITQWSAEHETDIALGFLGEAAAGLADDGRPFGLVVSYNPPHQPFVQVPARYLAPYAGLPAERLLPRPNVDHGSRVAREAAAVAPYYFAAVTGVDEQIGRLLAGLDSYGLTRDTVVVFTSDHGMQLGSHGLLYKNVPYDESMRVPFLISRPGRIAPGEDELLLGSADFAPTLLGLLGLARHIPDGTQGRDLSAALLGPPDGPRTGAPEGVLYLGPGQEAEDPDVRGLRTRTHKLVCTREPDGTLTTRLGDLVNDPYERADVSAEQPSLTATLVRSLLAELERVGDPWPGRAALAAAYGHPEDADAPPDDRPTRAAGSRRT